MNKVFKIMGIAALMTGMTTGAMAQEQTRRQINLDSSNRHSAT